jgi:SAM-dependent methyltransferase
MDPLPSDPDDPRLRGWYHTIDLAPGLTTVNAVYDHRPIVDRVGFPSSLRGKTALDVGTADGFWAFEMERRGADRVVAIDIAQLGQSDVLPILRQKLPASWAASENYCAQRFWTAHAMRESRVEYRTGSVYELSPDRVGTFDVVYCGSLLVHLFNPLQALINIRSVTRELAIIEVCTFDPDYDPIELAFPDSPCMMFGSMKADGEQPGRHCMYWHFTRRALCDMMAYAGFAATEAQEPYRISGPGGGNLCVATVVGYVEPRAESRTNAAPTGLDYWRLRSELTIARTELEALRRQSTSSAGIAAGRPAPMRPLGRISRSFPKLSRAVKKLARWNPPSA